MVLHAIVFLAPAAEVAVPCALKCGRLRSRRISTLGVIQILKAEQSNAIVYSVEVGCVVDSCAEPVCVIAFKVTLKLLKVASVAEFYVIGFSHCVVTEEEICELARVVGTLVYIARECDRHFNAAPVQYFAVADIVLSEILVGVSGL